MGNRVLMVLCVLLVLSTLGAELAQAQQDWVIGGKEDESANGVVRSWDPVNGFVLAGWSRSFFQGYPSPRLPFITWVSGGQSVIRSLFIGHPWQPRILEGEATSIIAVSDNHQVKDYVVTGWVRPREEPNTPHIFVVKLRHDFSVVWSKLYHLELTGPEYMHKSFSIIEYRSNKPEFDGYALTGVCSTDGKNRDVLVMRLNFAGDIIWSNTYPLHGENRFQSEGYSICQIQDPDDPAMTLAVAGAVRFEGEQLPWCDEAFLMTLREDGSFCYVRSAEDPQKSDRNRQARSVIWDKGHDACSIVVSGWTESPDNVAPFSSFTWVSRFNTNAAHLWSSAVFWTNQYPTNDKVWGDRSLVRTEDEDGVGYILTGATNSFLPLSQNPTQNMTVYKVMQDGELGWGAQASVYPLKENYCDDIHTGGIALTTVPGTQFGQSSQCVAAVGWSNLSCPVTKKNDFLLTFFNAVNGNNLMQECFQKHELRKDGFEWKYRLFAKVEKYGFRYTPLIINYCTPQIKPACQ